jgi:hypothetical protein
MVATAVAVPPAVSVALPGAIEQEGASAVPAGLTEHARFTVPLNPETEATAMLLVATAPEARVIEEGVETSVKLPSEVTTSETAAEVEPAKLPSPE